MRFRIGLVIGFGVGYYLGARAGRARYEQMRRRLERLRDSRVFERMQAAVELGVERLRPEDEPDPAQLRLVDLESVPQTSSR
jgi:hypothetical protein